MSDRYVVSRVELGGLIDAVWEDLGYTAPTRQRNDAILDVWLSIKPKAPAADIDGRLTRIEDMLTQSLSANNKSWFALGQDVREVKAMLQKITQAPSITRGPGPLDISVTTEDGRTASIKTVYPSADEASRRLLDDLKRMLAEKGRLPAEASENPEPETDPHAPAQGRGV